MPSSSPIASSDRRAVRWRLAGRVQGVGFRPSAYRLARALGLDGSVRNTPEGAEIVLAGPTAAVETFLRDFVGTLPAAAEPLPSPPVPLPTDVPPPPSPFVILPSAPANAERPALVLPDLATCPDCLRELRDPANPRYRYPFITCSHCGPRASIITALPYDRPATTMAGFPLCSRCAAEYADPANRRFHAQPIACPVCGPHLEYRPSPAAPKTHEFTVKAGVLSQNTPPAPSPSPLVGEDALAAAEAELRAGRIVAVKGIGGFHLMALATDDAAVARLRAVKRRPEKPFALLCPSLDAIRAVCHLRPAEARWLTSPAAPIVILRRRFPAPASAPRLSPLLAPHLDTLGCFLPYSPLHWLLLDDLGLPLVATSANLSDEPLVTDNDEALRELSPLCDAFLLHNRPIAAPYDDSVMLVDYADRPLFLRRARGLAHYSLPAPPTLPPGRLAAGPASKSTVALSLPDRTIAVSAHIGDLATPRSIARWHTTAADLQRLHSTPLAALACDLHPDYPSTRLARALAADRHVPLAPVQHHHAHALAAALEHHLPYPFLAFALDGTGLAPDRASIWGFQALLLSSPRDFAPVAFLRPFPLPGPDAAARRPLQTAYALCHAWNLPFPAPLADALPAATRALLDALVAAPSPTPLAPRCSSCGRLFDVAAALLGLAHTTTAEAYPALLLQTAATLAYDTLHETKAPLPSPYPFDLAPDGTLDPAPMIAELARHAEAQHHLPPLADQPPDVLPLLATHLPALRFHLTIAHMLLAVARTHPDLPLALVGGCFQNPLLLHLTESLLRAENRSPYSLHVLPPSDAGLAPASLLALPL